MKAKGRLLIFTAQIMLALTACAPDPRQEAKAHEIVVLANAQAAQSAQDLEQDAELHTLDVEAATMDLQDRKAAQAAFQTGLVTMVRFGMLAATIALCVVVLGLGWTVKETTIGFGQAAVAKAFIQAGLVHMDKSTRTFPAFIDVRQIGTLHVAMLSSGQVFKMDETARANPQLVAMLAQVAATGAALQEMKGAKDAQGMAIFSPEIIEAATADITVGKNIAARRQA